MVVIRGGGYGTAWKRVRDWIRLGKATISTSKNRSSVLHFGRHQCVDTATLLKCPMEQQQHTLCPYLGWSLCSANRASKAAGRRAAGEDTEWRKRRPLLREGLLKRPASYSRTMWDKEVDQSVQRGSPMVGEPNGLDEWERTGEDNTSMLEGVIVGTEAHVYATGYATVSKVFGQNWRWWESKETLPLWSLLLSEQTSTVNCMNTAIHAVLTTVCSLYQLAV